MTKTQILELEKDFKAYKIKLFVKRALLFCIFCACCVGGFYAFALYKAKQNTLEIALNEKSKMQEKLEIAKLEIQKAQILNEKKHFAQPKENVMPQNKEKITIHSYMANITNLEQNFHQKADYKSALHIASLYFADKNYQKALWWSLKANELDKNDAGSWIVFAKASFALGKKDDAKRALQSFLYFYDDESILDEVGYILK